MKPLHAPKMVGLCLKVGPCIFWIGFQVQAQISTYTIFKSAVYKFKFRLELENQSKTV